MLEPSVRKIEKGKRRNFMGGGRILRRRPFVNVVTFVTMCTVMSHLCSLACAGGRGGGQIRFVTRLDPDDSNIFSPASAQVGRLFQPGRFGIHLPKLSKVGCKARQEAWNLKLGCRVTRLIAFTGL